MKNLLKPVAIFSGIMLSAVSGVGAAQAGVLTPPPPNSTTGFSPVVSSVTVPSGVNVKFRSASDCPVNGFAGICNNTGISGSSGPEVALFDFFPPNGGGFGNFKVDNSQPTPSNVFSNATGGRIQDFVLPYFGQGFNPVPPGFPVAFNVANFLDFDKDNLYTGTDDQFDAKFLTSLVFVSTSGSSALVQFNFEGVYHIDGEEYQGAVNISQSISGLNANGVVRQARTPNGFTTSFSGQTNVAVPEPLTMLGAGAALGFGSFFKRKISKTKKGNKAA